MGPSAHSSPPAPTPPQLAASRSSLGLTSGLMSGRPMTFSSTECSQTYQELLNYRASRLVRRPETCYFST